jgi:hypothetical protein
MTSKKAKGELEGRRKELAALVEEQAKVSRELQGLKDERARAVRLLAGGDNSQRKRILALEQEAAPLALRLEGLAGLISEAQAKVTEVEGVLKQVEAEEHSRALAAAQERETRECERIRAEVGRHEQHIYKLYASLCGELAQYLVNLHRIGASAMADDGFGLKTRLAAMAQAEGWKLFNICGPLATLQLWPMVKAPEWGGTVDFKNYVERIKNRAFEAHLKEISHEI